MFPLFPSALLLTLGAGTEWQSPRVVGGNCQAPAFSARADWASYELNHHETRRIETWVVNRASGATDLLSPPSAGPGAPAAFGGRAATVVHDLVWAPASALTFANQYVYSASDGAGEFELYSYQGTTPAPGPGHDGDPSWNPTDESKLVFTSARSGEGDLYLLDFARPGEPTRLTQMSNSSEVDAAWSPDGRSVAFVAHSNAGDNIWLLDDVARGGQPRRLTQDVATQVRPTWAPTAPLRLAFYGVSSSNTANIDRVDLWVATPSGALRKLVEGVVPDSHGPAWTPDGESLIVVLDDDARFDPVVRVDAKSGATQTLDTQTVGNRDLAVGTDSTGALVLAVCAQGTRTAPQKDFLRLYLRPISL